VENSDINFRLWVLVECVTFTHGRLQLQVYVVGVITADLSAQSAGRAAAADVL